VDGWTFPKDVSVEKVGEMRYEAECPECEQEFAVEGVYPEYCVVCAASLKEEVES
jgi:hypothetical protein